MPTATALDATPRAARQRTTDHATSALSYPAGNLVRRPVGHSHLRLWLHAVRRLRLLHMAGGAAGEARRHRPAARAGPGPLPVRRRHPGGAADVHDPVSPALV